MSVGLVNLSQNNQSQLDSQIQSLLSNLEGDVSSGRLANYFKNREEEYKDLLIEYIQANTEQDREEIGKQITQLGQTMATDVQNINTVKQGIASIESNPNNWNSDTLSTLLHYKSLLAPVEALEA